MKRKGGEEESLFQTSVPPHEPLASRMRPRTLDEFSGQDHIIGKGRLLRRSIQADQLSSIIFSGPPGTGKTTLARVIANTTSSRFITLNAVLSGVQDIRTSVEEAKDSRNLHGRKTILFVDEVHRWNKSQQDALLPWVENGTVILIGATTENPFFEVNRALVSRSRIFGLLPLTAKNLETILDQALADKERGYGAWRVTLDADAKKHLVDTASGDARTLLNALELAVETSVEAWPPENGKEIRVGMTEAEESIQKRAVLYDKDGDYHFDTISAFIKSLRGSDPDAALYWLARMVRSGEDPDFIFRRMLVSACEDIGLAEPNAISVVSACATAFSRTGYPEGNFHLAHAALYLANCPKSNSVMGFFKALESINERDAEIPTHLKDPSRDKEGFGHGEGYKYPHAFKGHWVPQDYLPETLKESVFYIPSNEGWEKSIAHQVSSRREASLALSMKAEPSGDSLTYAKDLTGRDSWYRRIAERSHISLIAVRDRMLKMAAVPRHARVLVANADDGILFWECARKTPEGLTAGLFANDGIMETFRDYSSRFTPLEAPRFVLDTRTKDLKTLFLEETGTDEFDFILGVDILKKSKGKGDDVTRLENLLVPKGTIILCETLPREGTRLSTLVSISESGTEISGRLAELETSFRESGSEGPASFGEETIIRALADAGLIVLQSEKDATEGRRLATDRDIALWTNPVISPFMKFIAEREGDEFIEHVSLALKSALAASGQDGLPWKTTRFFAAARLGRDK